MNQKIITFINKVLEEYKDAHDDYYLDRINSGSDQQNAWRLYRVDFDTSTPYHGIVVAINDGIKIVAQKKDKLDNFTDQGVGKEDAITLLNKLIFLFKNNKQDAKNELIERIDNELNTICSKNNDETVKNVSINNDDSDVQKDTINASNSIKDKRQNDAVANKKQSTNLNDENISDNSSDPTNNNSSNDEWAVYIIKTDGGMVNIGISKTPENKKDKLQSASPNKLKLYKTWWVANKTKAKKIQGRVCKLLEDLKTESENGWFNITPEHAQHIIRSVIKKFVAGKGYRNIKNNEAKQNKISCSHCNSKNKPSNKYCTGCGKRLPKQENNNINNEQNGWSRGKKNLLSLCLVIIIITAGFGFVAGYAGLVDEDNINTTSNNSNNNYETMDEHEVWYYCKKYARDRLKAPSTATFSGPTNYYNDGKAWEVEGYVDAENAFGAKLRKSVTCRAKNTGPTVKIISFNLGTSGSM